MPSPTHTLDARPTSTDVIDLFAGPGGWDTGAAALAMPTSNAEERAA
jgi:hypothetical protein